MARVQKFLYPLFFVCCVLVVICTKWSADVVFTTIEQLSDDSSVAVCLATSTNYVTDKTGFTIDFNQLVDTTQHPSAIYITLLLTTFTIWATWYSYIFVTGLYCFVGDDEKAYYFEPEMVFVATGSKATGGSNYTNLTRKSGLNRQETVLGKYDPRRVFKLIRAAFHQVWVIVAYARTYLKLAGVHKECMEYCKEKRCDLKARSFGDLYDGTSFISVLQQQYELKHRRLQTELRLEKQEIEQSNYRELVSHTADDLPLREVSAYEMVAITNIHYDKNDPRYTMHVYAPLSPSFSVDEGEYKEQCRKYKQKMAQKKLHIQSNSNTNANANANANPSPNNNNNSKKNKSSHIPARYYDTSYDRMAIGPTPCVIFLYGGAWGGVDDTLATAMAKSFLSQKMAFVYPTFVSHPHGNMENILSNMVAVIQWVVRFHELFNIDHKQILLIGHSAGAQIGSMLISRSIEDCEYKWLKYIRLFVGLSGPYDILDHYYHESRRGVEAVSGMGRCMKGRKNFHRYSPTNLVTKWAILLKHARMKRSNGSGNSNSSNSSSSSNADDNDDNDEDIKGCKHAEEYWPKTLLIHGTGDAVVPIVSSTRFYKGLRKLNIDVELNLYEDINHYEPLFGLANRESPIYARLITDILTRFYDAKLEYHKEEIEKKKSGKNQNQNQNQNQMQNNQNQNENSKQKGNSGRNKNVKNKQQKQQRLEPIVEQQHEHEQDQEHVEQKYDYRNNGNNDNKNTKRGYKIKGRNLQNGGIVEEDPNDEQNENKQARQSESESESESDRENEGERERTSGNDENKNDEHSGNMEEKIDETPSTTRAQSNEMKDDVFSIFENDEFTRQRKERQLKQQRMVERIRELCEIQDDIQSKKKENKNDNENENENENGNGNTADGEKTNKEDVDDLTVDLLQSLLENMDSSMDRMNKVKKYGDHTVNEILKLTKESL